VLRRRRPLLRDALGRDPRTRGHAAPSPVLVELDGSSGATDAALRIAVDGHTLTLDAPIDPTDPDALDRLADQLATLLAAGLADPAAVAADLPLLGPSEVALLDAINETGLDHDRTATID